MMHGRVPVGLGARHHMHARFYSLTTVRAVLHVVLLAGKPEHGPESFWPAPMSDEPLS